MNTLPTTTRLAILAVLLPLLVVSHSLRAQSDTISASINTDAEELIRDIFLGSGQCFEVFNIELNGEPAQAGSFTNGFSSIGFEEGLVLSNGDIRDAAGPNLGYILNDADASTGHGGMSTDPDLEILSELEGSTNPLFWDVVTLEFDFTPTLDTISFEYVFASEEYCDFAFTSFVDLFGFFISGPGISGPFTDGGINLAQVPGTGQAISAQNVNQILNTGFYNNNIPPGEVGCSFGQPAPNSDFIAFDGYTVPLTASTPVIPCETYHLRLVVADRGFDNRLDAAVFLRANSFAAGLTSRITSQVTGPSQGNDSPYEGCGFTSIIFSRGDSIVTDDLVVYYDLLANSTATPGVDYMALPDSVIIPAGQLTDTINLDFFADDITEGTEFFTVKLRNPCNCSESELTINILEPPPLSGTIEGMDRICEGDAVSLAAVPSGGIGEISYEWSNGDVDSLFNFVPSMTDTYEVIISDECGSADTIQQMVSVQAPSATIDGNVVLCDGRPTEDLAIILNDGDSFTFDVFENGNPTTFSNITADTFFLPVSNTGVYQIGNLIADGCPGSVNGEGQVLFVEIDTDFDIDSISCFGDANAAISLNPVGGTGVYDYVWTHDIALNADSIGGLDIGMYTAFISDSNGCVDTISVTIDQAPLLELMVDTLALFADCITGGALQANGSGGTGAYSFLWSDGETSSLNNNLAPGNYDLELRDENNCLASSSIAILADTLSPTLLLTVSDSLDCGTSSVMVDASGSSQGMNFTYQWTDPNGMIITPPDPLLFDAAEAGTYTLNITNIDNSCSQTDSLEVIQLADGLTVNLGGDTDLNCFQPDGQLFFLDSMPDFSATWELLDGTVLATGVNNLTVSEPNTYVLLVDQLSNGCVGRDTIVVMADQDAPILSLSNTPDSLDCDISQVLVDVEISNGSGNYSYNWDGPAGGIVGSTNGQDVEGSLPGLYQLIATDADNGCQDTLTYEIIQDQSDLVIDPLPDTTLTCDVLAIDYTASSPNTGNLQFEWFDAMNNSIALSPDVTFTQTGVYTLQLTDLDNNCSQTAALEVTADTLRPAVTALLPDELTCVNDSVTLAIEPGLPDYSVRWRTAMGDVLSSDTWTQEVGDGGGYMLTVTDDRNGCRTVVIFEVLSDTVAPVITFDLADTLTCVTNEVDLSPSMITGSGTYEYLWAGPVGGIVGSVDQMQITAVEAGSYDLTVTDAQNGCVDSMQTIVEVDRVDPVLSVLNDTLINCFNPEILLSASSSSAGDLDFEWFDDQGMSLAQGPDLMVDEQGDYRVVLTNTRNGCTDELSLNVMDDSILPTAEAGADVTIDCDNNTATLTGTEGPNNWTPTWLDANGMVLSTGEWTLMTSAPGMYTLSVLDTANGCEASDEAEVQIDQNFPVATVGTLNQVDCFSNSATIDASGSSQGTNFTYQVVNDNGNVVLQPSGLFFDLSNPGSYQFVVTNTDNNCSAAADFTVTQTEPSISSLEVSDIPCGASSGTIVFAEVTDGTPPYLYSIDNGNSFSTDPIFSGLEPGNYDLVVQDVNGCEAGSSTFITQALGVELSLPEQVELDFLQVFTLEPLLLNVNPNELVEIKWSGSNELSCQDCLNPIFTATETTRLLISVTDENGCTAEATMLLLVDQTVPIFIPNAFSPDGLDGANDFFTVYADAAQVLEVRQINIFDRWGGLVFSKNNLPINAPSEGWDGTQNGTILNSGVYVYWVEVILQTGESKIMEGDVLLLR